MRRFLIVISFFISGIANAADENWSWLRVESGLPRPVVMQGLAKTISSEHNKLVLRLISKDKSFDDFTVRIQRSGKKLYAEFEPPNTERVKLDVSGTFHASPTGAGTIYEEMILANTMNGNFLIISRVRQNE